MSLISYIAVYSLLFLLAILSNNKTKCQYLYLIAWLVLVLFTGLREFGGSDFHVYKSYFLQQADFGYAIGYQLYNRLIYFFTQNYNIYILLTSALSISLLFIFLKKNPYGLYILTFYFGSKFLWHDFVLIRQSVAIPLFAISVQYIHKSKFLKYALLNALGALFHVSALLLIPMYFIFKLRTAYAVLMSVVFAIIVLQTLIFLSSNQLLDSLYEEYNLATLGHLINHLSPTKPNSQSINILFYLYTGIILCLVSFRYKTLNNTMPEFTTYVNIVCMFLIFALFFYNIIAFRRYTEYAELCIISLVVHYIFSYTKQLNKLVLLSAFGAIYLAQLIRFLFIFDNGAMLN